jgi:hypothetical protein
MPPAGTARTEPSHLRRRPCAVVHTPTRPNRARGRRRARLVGAARRARPQGAADQPGQQGPAAAALRADRLGHPGRRAEPARAAPCRIAAVDGRSDDVITLPAAGGGEVAVHPFRLQAPFSQLLEVRQHQIVYDADGLHVALVLRGSAPEGLSARVQAPWPASCATPARSRRPSSSPPLRAIDRDTGHGAKLKLVRNTLRHARPRPRARPNLARRNRVPRWGRLPRRAGGCPPLSTAPPRRTEPRPDGPNPAPADPAPPGGQPCGRTEASACPSRRATSPSTRARYPLSSSKTKTSSPRRRRRHPRRTQCSAVELSSSAPWSSCSGDDIDDLARDMDNPGHPVLVDKPRDGPERQRRLAHLVLAGVMTDGDLPASPPVDRDR